MDELVEIAHTVGFDFERIRPFLRPTLLLQPDPSGPHVFGGSVALPPSTSWPMWDPTSYLDLEIAEAKRYQARYPTASGWAPRMEALQRQRQQGPVPLSALIEVQCSAVPRGLPGLDLPDSGVLQVFAELGLGAACGQRALDLPPYRVYWHPDPDAWTLQTPPPSVRGATTPLQSVAAWSTPQHVAGHLSLFDDEGFDDFLSALESAGLLGTNQLGGHAFLLQDPTRDPRDAIVDVDSGIDLYTPTAHRGRPRRSVPSDWSMLLQVATDYDPGPSWSGVMSFWRREGPWEPGLQTVHVYYEDT